VWIRPDLAALAVLAGLVVGCARTAYESLPPPADPLPIAQEQQSSEPASARPETSPAPDSLVLDEAIRTALARNPDVTGAAEHIAVAEARLREARGAFLPLLTLDASALRADSPSTYLFKRIDQRGLKPGVDFNHPDKLTNYEAGVTLRYDLFSGGKDAASLDMAGKDLDLARLNQEWVRNELISGVITTFHEIITADELLAAEAAAVETVKTQVHEAEARFRAGAVLRDEVLSLEVRLAEAEDRFIAARNVGRLARAALASLLAVEPAGGEGLKCRDVPPPPVPEICEAGLALAQRRDPILRSAHLAKKKAAAGYLPTVGVFARYYHDVEKARFNHNDANWILGADLTWNLFNGLRTRAGYAAAGAAVKRAEAEVHRARLDLEHRVRDAYIRLEGARSRRKVTEAVVDRAAETFELVTQRYRKGAVTVTRYLEAEQDRTFARVKALRARCMERRSLAEVARVLGWWTIGRAGEP